MEPEPVAPGQVDQGAYPPDISGPVGALEPEVYKGPSPVSEGPQGLPSPTVGTAKFPAGANVPAPGPGDYKIVDVSVAVQCEAADDTPECCDKKRPLLAKPKDGHMAAMPGKAIGFLPPKSALFMDVDSGHFVQNIPRINEPKPCAMCKKPMKGLMSWATPDGMQIVCNSKSYTKDKRSKFFQCSECGIICTFSEYTNTPITITFVDAVEPKAEEYALPAPFAANPREDTYDQ